MMTKILATITIISAVFLVGYIAGSIMEEHSIANYGGIAILSFATTLCILMVVAAVVEKDDT